MEAKRFVAADMKRGLQMVKEYLGDNAVILSSKKKEDGIEIIATTDYSVEDMEEHHAREIAPVASKIYRELTGVSLQEHEVSAKLKNTRSTYTGAQQAELPSIEKNEINDMRDELASLRHILSNMANLREAPQDTQPKLAPVQAPVFVAPAPPPSFYGQAYLSPVQQQIKQRLELMGLPNSWHDGVLNLIAAQAAAQYSIKNAWRLVMAHLQRKMTVAKHDWVDAGGIFAFVGPTGAGKTTTLAKCAARYAMRYGSEAVALISLDTQRVGATQQLKAMSKMLGIQVRTAENSNELDVALRVFKKCSLVLIDTAGSQPGSAEQQKLLQCLNSDKRIKTLLTLPATSQYPVLKTQLHCYRQLAKGVIITKTDEAISLGESMAAVIDSQLPLVYTTDGQRIPQNIAVPNLLSFMKLAIDKIKMAYAIQNDSPAYSQRFNTEYQQNITDPLNVRGSLNSRSVFGERISAPIERQKVSRRRHFHVA